MKDSRSVEINSIPGRFSRQFILSFSILLAAVLIFNITVNPYGIYPTRWLKPLIWSDRREKLELLEKYPKPVNLLIMGSSRMMRIDPELIDSLTGLNGFNLAVNHARTEDFLALLRYALTNRDLHLKAVIIGLDLHAFRGNYEMDNLLKYYPELFYYISREKQPPWARYLAVNWYKVTKGLSLHQTEKSAEALGRFLKSGKWENSYDFVSDGRMNYNRLEDIPGENDSLRLEQNLSNALDRYHGTYMNYGGISMDRLGYLKNISELCRLRNIELVAVMLPYHPKLLAAIGDTPFSKYNSQWEQYMLDAAADLDFTLVDARTLEAFGGSPLDFYDEIHMTQANMDRLARYIVARSGLGEGHAL